MEWPLPNGSEPGTGAVRTRAAERADSRRARREHYALPGPFQGKAASVFYRVLKYVILGPLLRMFFRPRIEGMENVPESGAAIVAGNHLSFSDHFVMPAVLPRRITFLAKAEYFTGPGLKGKLTSAFFRGVGQIPVDRSGGGAGQSAIDAALGVLARGELLGIYPEGTRSHDGRLYRGRTGVARDGAAGGRARGALRDGRHLRNSSRPGGSSPGWAASPSASAGRWTSAASPGWPTSATSYGR